MRTTVGQLRSFVCEALDENDASRVMNVFVEFVNKPLMHSKERAERLAAMHNGLDEKLLKYHRLIWEATHSDMADTTEGKQRLGSMLSDLESFVRWLPMQGGTLNSNDEGFRLFVKEIKALIDKPYETKKPIEPELTAAQRRALIAKNCQEDNVSSCCTRPMLLPMGF